MRQTTPILAMDIESMVTATAIAMVMAAMEKNKFGTHCFYSFLQSLSNATDGH